MISQEMKDFIKKEAAAAESTLIAAGFVARVGPNAFTLTPAGHEAFEKSQGAADPVEAFYVLVEEALVARN